MSVPAPPVLTAPYVTVPEFQTAPTWLDSDDLVPGGTADAQDAELFNVLLRASQWADDRADQRLGAHPVVEQMRARIDRRGRLSLHAASTPVRDVTALAYGPDPAALSPLADLSGVWIEDGRQVLAMLAAGFSGGAGVRLEFGSAAVGGEVFVRLGYVAGFVATVLTEDAAQDATSVTVDDATGIYPGDVLRIWEPGAEEAVTVATGYTPGETTVPLAGSLKAVHTAGAGLSGMPASLKQAVITKAVSLLLREDTASDGAFGGSAIEPTARRASAESRAGTLAAQAEQLISSYRRIR